MRLSEVRSAMESCAAGFDAVLLSARDAARAIEHAAAIKNMAAAIEAMAAARVAESKVWTETGDRSAAHYLARTTGASIAQATDTLRMAERLRDAPATEEALRAGELSLQQAAAITDAVAANPGVERELLDQAGRASLGELRHEAAQAKATRVDLEARRRRIHERRSLRHSSTVKGSGTSTCATTPSAAHSSWAPWAARAIGCSRPPGRREGASHSRPTPLMRCSRW